MMFLNWTRVAILYEDEYGLIRLQELVRAPPSKNVEIYIRQTGPDNYRFWVLLKLVNYCPLNINCNLYVPSTLRSLMIPWLQKGAEGDQEEGDLQHHRGHWQSAHPALLQEPAAAPDEQWQGEPGGRMFLGTQFDLLLHSITTPSLHLMWRRWIWRTLNTIRSTSPPSGIERIPVIIQ